ncbi:MAG: EamA family transporter, partial [Clostridia bacterium]|nr:EamA family transporter [Clostridia bacterium]
MSKYTVGVDFGTLSARALVVEIGTGRELCNATMNYPHAVMDEYLPDGTRLKPDWALQHPQDYLDCLKYVVPEAVHLSGINAEDIIGIGIDFTACTLIPVDKEGWPLCLKSEFEHHPHAWPKLWKHHGTQDEANKITEIAKARNEKFVSRYGEKHSSEWMYPKIWQILDEAPEIYEATDKFIEAGDWIVMQMTGVEKRSSSIAGYKAQWHKTEGYPSDDFFKALDPRLEHLVDEKLSRDLYPVGTRAGDLTEKGAALVGLRPGIAVAVANVDAHVSLPPAGLVNPGDLLMLGCAVAFAVQILFVDRFAPEVDALRLNCLQALVCTVCSAVIMVFTESVTVSGLLDCWLPLCYAGFLSMGAAYALQIVGQKYIEPTTASLIMSLESVFAVLSGWLLIG